MAKIAQSPTEIAFAAFLAWIEQARTVAAAFEAIGMGVPPEMQHLVAGNGNGNGHKNGTNGHAKKKAAPIAVEDIKAAHAKVKENGKTDSLSGVLCERCHGTKLREGRSKPCASCAKKVCAACKIGDTCLDCAERGEQ